MNCRPIGVVRTPWATPSECPGNGRALDPAPLCHAEVLPDLWDALDGIEGFSHLILLYWLDRAEVLQCGEPVLRVTPRSSDRPRGIFATRAPVRPNPIGLSVVTFEGIERPGVLAIRHIDCVDGTKLLDIKPYIARIDSRPEASRGWLAKPG